MAATVLDKVAAAFGGKSDEHLDEEIAEARAALRSFARDRPPTRDRAVLAARVTCAWARSAADQRLEVLKLMQSPIDMLTPELREFGIFSSIAAGEEPWLLKIEAAAEAGELSRTTVAEEEKKAAELRAAIDRLEREQERRRLDAMSAAVGGKRRRLEDDSAPVEVQQPSGAIRVVDADGKVVRTGDVNQIALWRDSQLTLAMTRRHNAAQRDANGKREEYVAPVFTIVPLDAVGDPIVRLAAEWSP